MEEGPLIAPTWQPASAGRAGGMKAEFVPDNTVGGPGDKLHPNRFGYQAMGMAIDLGMFGVRAK